jgi:hypothetical protein
VQIISSRADLPFCHVFTQGFVTTWDPRGPPTSTRLSNSGLTIHLPPELVYAINGVLDTAICGRELETLVLRGRTAQVGAEHFRCSVLNCARFLRIFQNIIHTAMLYFQRISLVLGI